MTGMFINAETKYSWDDSFREPGVPENLYGDTSFGDVPSPYQISSTAKSWPHCFGNPNSRTPAFSYPKKRVLGRRLFSLKIHMFLRHLTDTVTDAQLIQSAILELGKYVRAADIELFLRRLVKVTFESVKALKLRRSH